MYLRRSSSKNLNKPCSINTDSSIPIHSQTVASQRKRENLERRKRKMTPHIQGSINTVTADLSPETMETKRELNDIQSIDLRKKTVNPEFYMQQNCPSEMKTKKTFSNKDWENPLLADLPVLQAKRKEHFGNLGSQGELKSTGNNKCVD